VTRGSSVDLSSFEREFAGDSALRTSLFRNDVAGPAVSAAFADAGK